ncbi:hypothetical protein LT331_002216 [Enterococcus faecium]|nr:hypothetical protein [Enterococcus faecium]
MSGLEGAESHGKAY